MLPKVLIAGALWLLKVVAEDQDPKYIETGDRATLLAKLLPTESAYDGRRVRNGRLLKESACSNMILDLGIIIDASNSSEKFWDEVEDFFDGFAEEASALQKIRRVGFATHVDKPLPLTGYTDQQSARADYCLDILQPLKPVEDFDITDYRNKVQLGGGNDWKEGGLDAIARAATGFKFEKDAVHNGKKVLNVVWLLTSSLPHLSGEAGHVVAEYNKKAEKPLPYPKVFDASFDYSKDPNHECATMEYPSLADISEIQSKTDVTFFVTALSSPYPKEYCQKKGATKCTWGPLQELAKKFNDPKYLREGGVRFGWAYYLSSSRHWNYAAAYEYYAMDGVNVFIQAAMNACESENKGSLEEEHSLSEMSAPPMVGALMAPSKPNEKQTILVNGKPGATKHTIRTDKHVDGSGNCHHDDGCGCHNKGTCGHHHKKIDIQIDIDSF